MIMYASLVKIYMYVNTLTRFSPTDRLYSVLQRKLHDYGVFLEAVDMGHTSVVKFLLERAEPISGSSLREYTEAIPQ